MEKQRDLTWLENLQRNSWEPEVIISGITLAFLFVVPARVYTFSAMLIQDLGIPYLASSLILLYLTSITSVLKIFFVFHLVLRFLWAGLLGLSYAFPEGVINENLFQRSRLLPYKTPEYMVLKMEKVCSMAFAYPVSLLFGFFAVTIILGVVVLAYLWVDISFFFVYLVGMALLAGILFYLILGKQSKIRKWYAGTFVSSVAAIYQSNLGKWYSLGYGICIFMLAIPLIFTDTRDFSLFFNGVDLNKNETEWPAKSLYFEEDHDPEKRYGRIILPAEEVSDGKLTLGLARYLEDYEVMERLQEGDFDADLKKLNWQNLDQIPDLHRIYIDEKPVSMEVWRKERLPVSRQKIFRTVVMVDSLNKGYHRIRVEKLTLVHHIFTSKPELKVLENWALLEFFKM